MIEKILSDNKVNKITKTEQNVKYTIGIYIFCLPSAVVAASVL